MKTQAYDRTAEKRFVTYQIKEQTGDYDLPNYSARNGKQPVKTSEQNKLESIAEDISTGDLAALVKSGKVGNA